MKMYQIAQTELYEEWFADLRDRKGKEVILARLRRVEIGNFGDCEPVGEGVSELRIHFGPGYRVYLMKQGIEIVILLAGGDKSTQRRDIDGALDIARELKESGYGN